MNFFIAYELRVCADLEIPELRPWLDGSEREADLTIVKGVIPDEQKQLLPQVGPFLFANERSLLLIVPQIATFWVQAGERIVYQKNEGSTDDDLRAFLLGSCIGAILMQRGMLVLHGCTIQFEKGCIVCVGHSTAGKSTLAAAFMQSGANILSDDVCAIDQNGDVIAGIPRIKINHDVAEYLDIDTSDLNTIRAGCDNKFSLPLNEQFCSRRLPLLAVYELSAEREDTRLYSDLNSLERFSVLSRNLYRPRYVKAMKSNEENFRRCSELAQNIHISRISRPAFPFSINELRSLIIEDLNCLKVAIT